MKGCYILILRLSRDLTLRIGSLGHVELNAGYYIYVGSGMGNVLKRVERHFRKGKRRRWHIDYLTEVADEMYALIIPSDVKIECQIARFFACNFRGIKGFGCSDCSCESHLFYYG